MANSKISALPAATTPLGGTELVPVVQGGITEQVSVANLTAGRQVSMSGATLTGGTIKGVTYINSSNVLTSNSTLVWDDSTTRLGIGTTSPANTVNVVSANVAGTDNIGNVFIRTTDSYAAADVGGKLTLGGFYNASSTYSFAGIAGRKENATINNVAGYLQFLTCTSGGTLTERWRINSTGNLVAASSGLGIDFSATAGTGTSELFADYEEGTWTPNQGSGLAVVGTFSSSGTYTKIGRTVFVTGKLSGSTSISTPTGDIITTNLPFTSLNAGSTGMGNMTNNSLNVTSSTWVNINTTTLYGNVTIAATTNVFFTAVYQT